jgi:ABC-type iron transport system FetAB ATPase subunit
MTGSEVGKATQRYIAGAAATRRANRECASNGAHALKVADPCLRRGEIVAVIRPRGRAKNTLLKRLSRLDALHESKVLS